MEAFLKEWYGILTFVAFDVLALLVIICITYRWLFKRILDFLAASVALVCTSPILLVSYLYATYQKKQGKIERILEKETYVGKKGKSITLHAFAIGKIGKLLRLFDVFCGRISFIGTMFLRAQDITFLDEDDDRLLLRPGLIHPLVLSGTKETDYEQALKAERKYFYQFSFFKDCKIFWTWLLKKIRGESGEYMGETGKEGYIDYLKRTGKITEQDYAAAMETFAK